jgi:hypothetical protein
MAAWLYEAFLLFAIAWSRPWCFPSRRHAQRHGPAPLAAQGFLAVVFAIYFSYLWSAGRRWR